MTPATCRGRDDGPTCWRRCSTTTTDAEDTVLFPALAARQPGAAVTTAEMEDQHVELDVALARLGADLSTDGDVRRLVERHLGAEEQLVLPMWLASFSADEHERFAGTLRRATPLRDAGLMIAWLLDTAPGRRRRRRVGPGAAGAAGRPPRVVAAALRAPLRHLDERPDGRRAPRAPRPVAAAGGVRGGHPTGCDEPDRDGRINDRTRHSWW